MTDLTGRHIRIETANPDGKKRPGNVRVHIDDIDVTNSVISIDYHADASSLPTATVHVINAEIDAEAFEAETIHGELVTAEPDTRIDDLANTLDAFAADTTAQITALAQQLQQLIIQTSPQCATCAAEMRQAARPDANLVNVIIDGTGYCHEHVDVVNGRLAPKKSSGLIVAGG